MLLFPLALATGVVAGFALGGRIGALAELKLRAVWLVFAAVAAQIVDGGLPAVRRAGTVGQLLLLASYLAVGAFLAWNLRGRRGALRAGFGLAAIGWLANMIVIAANGAMPVSVGALSQLHVRPADLASGGPFGKHLVGHGASLGFLGDDIALPALRAAISAGDIVMMSGIVIAVAAAMTSGRRRERAGPVEEATPERAA